MHNVSKKTALSVCTLARATALYAHPCELAPCFVTSGVGMKVVKGGANMLSP